MAIKAVLFDIDGTLMPFDGIIKHLQEACRHFGLKVLTKNEIINGVIGFTANEILDKFYPEHIDLADEFVEYYRKIYIRDAKKMRPFPGTANVLRSLKRNFIKVGIVTTKTRSQSLAMLELFNLPCDALVAQEDVKKRKPNPEPVLKACRMLKVKPNACVFVGDHPFDMEAAVAAGCVPVGTLTGWGNRKNLKASGAKYLIRDLSSLRQIIEG